MTFIIILSFFVTIGRATFIQEIWNSIISTNLVHNSLETIYITGIKTGKLDPNCYMNYGLQDSSYLAHGAMLWGFACQQAALNGNKNFMGFCRTEHQYYANQSRQYRQQYSLRQGSVTPNEALNNYIKSKTAYVVEDYLNSLLVNYGCYKLWPWIAQQLKDTARKNDNIYYSWVTDNLSDEGAKRLQMQINLYQSHFTRTQAFDVIKKMVQHEIALFNSCSKNL